MSFSLTLRSIAGVRSVKPWTVLGGIRHLSSKKTDADPVAASEGLAAVTKRAKSKAQRKKEKAPEPELLEAKPSVKSGKYMSFDQLPKPPQDIIDLPLDKFYAKVYMRDVHEQPEITPSDVFKYKFEIPKQFVRSKELLNPKSSDPFDPSNSLIDSRVDISNGSSHLVDHPLKESITGMFMANPLMHSLDNDFLWNMYPKGQTFGNAPFGGDASFDGFRNWEKKMNEELLEKRKPIKKTEQEVQQFNAALNQSTSFCRKTNESTVEGGRRKLDRELLKQYRKYKKQGLIKKRNNNDDEDK